MEQKAIELFYATKIAGNSGVALHFPCVTAM